MSKLKDPSPKAPYNCKKYVRVRLPEIDEDLNIKSEKRCVVLRSAVFRLFSFRRGNCTDGVPFFTGLYLLYINK
jgi:hypothetical protein